MHINCAYVCVEYAHINCNCNCMLHGDRIATISSLLFSITYCKKEKEEEEKEKETECDNMT